MTLICTFDSDAYIDDKLITWNENVVFDIILFPLIMDNNYIHTCVAANARPLNQIKQKERPDLCKDRPSL